MASYTATLSLSNGTLSVTQPHPAPEAVTGLLDSVRYALLDGDNPITSVGISFVTDETAPAPEPVPAPEPEDGTISGPLSS